MEKTNIKCSINDKSSPEKKKKKNQSIRKFCLCPKMAPSDKSNNNYKRPFMNMAKKYLLIYTFFFIRHSSQ